MTSNDDSLRHRPTLDDRRAQLQPAGEIGFRDPGRSTGIRVAIAVALHGGGGPVAADLPRPDYQQPERLSGIRGPVHHGRRYAVDVGLIWPICVFLQTAGSATEGSPRLARTFVAILLFGLSTLFTAFAAVLYWNGHVTQQRGDATARSYQLQLSQDREFVSTHGPGAFTAPLTRTQMEAVRTFIASDRLVPSDADSIIERYPSEIAVLTALAERNVVTPAMLERLYSAAERLRARDADDTPTADLFTTIAANSNASPTFLADIAARGGVAARFAAARNANLPVDARRVFVERAAGSNSFGGHDFAAGDTLLSPTAARLLAADTNVWLRLGMNPATPNDVLEMIAGVPVFQETVLRNPRVTPDLTSALAQTLASSPLTATQRYLAAWRKVRQVILASGVAGLPAELSGTELDVLTAIVRTQPLGADDFRAAAVLSARRFELADALLHRRDTPADALRAIYATMLEKNAGGWSPRGTRQLSVLGTHPQLPPDLLTRMIESPDPVVREAGSHNPKLSAPLRTEYLDRAKDSRDPLELTSIARDPATPATILTHLAQNPAARWAVASNPAAPKSVLAELAAGSDAWPAALAKERLRSVDESVNRRTR